MREILFKAKRLDNGEWVQGNVFFADNGKCEICIGTPIVRITYEVDPETVCQYTGLTDKNGVKIFEGDILTDKFGNTGVVKYGEFNCGCCYDVFGYFLSDLIEFNHGRYENNETQCDLEVTGNIHDNA